MAAGDIGGIGDHEVERARERARPVAREHQAARRQPQPRQIVPRGARRALGPVHPYSEGGGIFHQQRREDRPRAGAEIEDAQRRGAVGPQGEGFLHQGFRIRARHQGLGGEGEGQAPEFLLAQDARHRLPGDAAGKKGVRGRDLGGGDGIVARQPRGGQAEGEGEQEPGVEIRAGKARRAQDVRHPPPQGRAGGGGHGVSPRRRPSAPPGAR